MKYEQTNTILNIIFLPKRTLRSAVAGNAGVTMIYNKGPYKTLEEIGKDLEKFKFSSDIKRHLLSKIQRTIRNEVNEFMRKENKSIGLLCRLNTESVFGIEELDTPKYTGFLTKDIVGKARETLKESLLHGDFDEPNPDKEGFPWSSHPA